jgi:hypothetical protein
MKKLNLDSLAVDSFATMDTPQQLRGTVHGRQQWGTLPPGITCFSTCPYTCDNATCDPSCRETQCVTACQGGGQLSREDCGGGGGGGGGGGDNGTGTGTDYIGCTNDCTTGMQTT